MSLLRDKKKNNCFFSSFSGEYCLMNLFMLLLVKKKNRNEEPMDICKIFAFRCLGQMHSFSKVLKCVL